MNLRTFARAAAIAAAIAGSAIAAPAFAQSPKIIVGYTATVDFAPGFIAMDQGLFKKRGLDVEFKLVPLNSQLPAAVESGSITFGGTTVSVLLQAVDGGLDQVAVAGSGVTDKDQKSFGAVVKADVAVAKPADFVGKKVGAPGLGAFLHVLFRNWLIDNGVDYKKVTFVEVGFPQMADVLKGGNVDAVVTGEPVMGRIVQANIGKKVTSFTDNLKTDLPIIVYSATRKWVDANPAAAKAFREAIAEGTAIANKDHAAVRAATAKFIKMPPEVIANMLLGRWNAEVTEAGMGAWIDIMKKQDMLRSALDVKKTIAR
ncbi:MAG: ABC transporter substrate-binding protein [Hyphomicrobiaceae bacterium]|jgi:NitT/TauT family transport system substrate-binding protein